MSRTARIAALAIAVGALFMLLAATAGAAQYSRVLPDGLSTNPTTATSRVNALVSVDAGVREAIASNHSLTADQLVGAKVVSVVQTSVVIGRTEDNSARVVGSGAIVPSSYMLGQKVFAWNITLKLADGREVSDHWKGDCSNPFLKRTATPPPLRVTTFTKTITMKLSRSKVTKKTITCPSGQQVTFEVTSKVTGKIRVKSLVRAVKLQSQRLSSKVKFDLKSSIRVICERFMAPSLTPLPPSIVIVNQTIVCGEGVVVVGNGNAAGAAGNNCNTTVVVIETPPVTPPPPKKPPPPAPPTVTITSMTTLNDVPEGKTSGPFYVTVNASASGGSATIDPGNGAISDCNSSTPQGSVTFDLSKGNNSLCVIYYAPTDSVDTGSITVTAILGIASDVETTTFLITHPVRP